MGRTTFSWAVSSDPGLRRSSNEDSYCTRPDLGLFVVADGMGGHVAGEVASRLAFDGDTAAADDLASLARRMSDTDVEVVRLRTALASLRDRASEARSAA